MRILATFNQEHTERWKLDSYSRRGDRQEGSWRWAFGIKLCIDDTDDKSTACLEATKLSVDDQQEVREEKRMVSSDTEKTYMLGVLSPWCFC